MGAREVRVREVGRGRRRGEKTGKKGVFIPFERMLEEGVSCLADRERASLRTG